MLKWGRYIVLEVGRELMLLASYSVEGSAGMCIYLRVRLRCCLPQNWHACDQECADSILVDVASNEWAE
jgi:hypothetical protein